MRVMRIPLLLVPGWDWGSDCATYALVSAGAGWFRGRTRAVPFEREVPARCGSAPMRRCRKVPALRGWVSRVEGASVARVCPASHETVSRRSLAITRGRRPGIGREIRQFQECTGQGRVDGEPPSRPCGAVTTGPHFRPPPGAARVIPGSHPAARRKVNGVSGGGGGRGRIRVLSPKPKKLGRE